MSLRLAKLAQSRLLKVEEVGHIYPEYSGKVVIARPEFIEGHVIIRFPP